MKSPDQELDCDFKNHNPQHWILGWEIKKREERGRENDSEWENKREALDPKFDEYTLDIYKKGYHL